ncbi:O-antigen ligase family protein [Maribacter sp. PR1]|uniref:O-antigen ligase family protein n=1 Tax=Maribacter cobaltidurans TaxID=1178778 RepID=A0ABU7IQK8_9FLAO|nr:MULTISPECIES: O-antigen ligase family protein [Maribacter]MDC6387791.1 O-antigen ligase family protein [Maribacter sp. PR1]MEE1975180.1 O-antigen ligase family protein [Maribacter cobaltidurans]
MALKHNLSVYWPHEKLIDNLIYLSFLGIVVSYPFSININSMFIIASTGLVLLKYFKTGKVFFSYLYLFFFLLFLTRLGSLLYTEDINSGVRIMMRSMSLIAFPLILMLNDKALPRKTFLIKIFILATTFACVYCFLKNAIFLTNNDIPIQRWLDWRYNNYHLSRHLEFGPNYFSLLIVLNIIGAFFHRKLIPPFYLLCLVLQVLFIILLSSRGLLLFLAIFSTTYTIYLGFKRFKFLGLLFSIVILSLLFYTIFKTVPVLRQRFVKTYKELVVGDMEKNKVGGIVTRKKKINASINIIKENFFIGVGIGDVRNELTHQFKILNFQEGVEKWYDAHNQYLESFMASGIFGVICFLSIFVYCFRHALNIQDYHLLAVLILFLFFGLLESYIETHKGIVIFSLVLTYYVSNNKNGTSCQISQI